MNPPHWPPPPPGRSAFELFLRWAPAGEQDYAMFFAELRWLLYEYGSLALAQGSVPVLSHPMNQPAPERPAKAEK